MAYSLAHGSLRSPKHITLTYRPIAVCAFVNRTKFSTATAAHDRMPPGKLESLQSVGCCQSAQAAKQHSRQTTRRNRVVCMCAWCIRTAPEVGKLATSFTWHMPETSKEAYPLTCTCKPTLNVQKKVRAGAKQSTMPLRSHSGRSAGGNTAPIAMLINVSVLTDGPY